jgi:nucleoside-diphosphate-sugar epimerase
MVDFTDRTMKKEKLCVTGLSGRLGSIIHRAMKDEYEITALNRREVPGVRTILADIARPESLEGSLRGQDVILHLAAYPFADDNWAEILPVNIVGMQNLLQAARSAGVRRFVFASSLSVLGGHLGSFVKWCQAGGFKRGADKVGFLEALEAPRPDSLYGVSKVFGESLCRLAVDAQRMSCVCLRLAEVRPDDRPLPDNPIGYAIMCRHKDFIAGVRRAIEHTRNASVYQIVTLISDDYQ